MTSHTSRRSVRRTLFTALTAVAGLAATAAASPRDAFSLSNIASDSPAVTQARSTAAMYQVQKIKVEGTLFKASASASRADEAVIQATAPNGMTFTIQPFALPSFGVVPGGQALTGGATITLPTPVDSRGTWRFRFTDTVNNAGLDARWNSVTITLFDGPPAATDLGTLSQPTTQIADAAFHSVRWFKFTVEQTATAAAGRYLNISTHKNSPLLAAEDPSVALYRPDGTLVAFNDNGPFSRHGILSFGRIPGNIIVDPFSGQDGALPAGTYYLGIGAVATSFGPDFSVRATSISHGTYGASISTNIHTPRCAADFNRDGAVTEADLSAFVSTYLNGCFPF